MRSVTTIITLLVWWVSVPLLATHNRAGEITYRHLQGNTYEITITTCTKESAIADRPYLHIMWGDESTPEPVDSLARSSITLLTPAMDAQINIYIGTHTYGGPGIYHLVVLDPNRNANINNIPYSVIQPFCIETILVINPQAGYNNSVQLLKPAKERACLNQPWIHNPTAYDPDGDLLKFSLVPCRGAGCLPIVGYQYPDASTPDPTDIFSIDENTGDVTWLVPTQVGEFNIAILIQEYRNGIFVGSVVRDMQITVQMCNNQPPVIQPLPDYCVDAGTLMEFTVNATDPNGDAVTLSAYGGPLTQVTNLATFNGNTGLFKWVPKCQEVRAQPYLVTFEATDNNFGSPLSDLESIFIRVVGPAVQNPTATATGNQIVLNWQSNPCAGFMSKIDSVFTRYKIYRRLNTFGFEPAQCEVGVPAYTGYTYLGQVQGVANTTYVDDQIFYGGNYCYMIVTCWPDGAEGYASEEVCAEIIRELPIMTKVSITATDLNAGADSVCWSHPYDLDIQTFQPPYQYKVFWRQAVSLWQEVHQSAMFNSFDTFSDTCFVHTGLNTVSAAHHYRVELWSNGQLTGTSAEASSIYTTPQPNDQSITLHMEAQVPWTNYKYFIFRYNQGTGNYDWIGESTTSEYTDTGLENNTEYCYYVSALGSYLADNYLDSLYNASQIICATPYDHNPPCPPVLSINPDCDTEINILTWTNPNHTCADDVSGYNLYYQRFEGEPFQLIATFNSDTDTVFVFNESSAYQSIAGCFAVTALDGPNLWPDGLLYRNESEYSNIECADNCPLYWLPNVFTPNGDLLNDTYRPIVYRYVESVNFRVYNRWGVEVYHTTEPALGWNGVSSETGRMCSDGVYFYTITVNTIRLSGIEPVSFSGQFQLLGGSTHAPAE